VYICEWPFDLRLHLTLTRYNIVQESATADIGAIIRIELLQTGSGIRKYSLLV